MQRNVSINSNNCWLKSKIMTVAFLSIQTNIQQINKWIFLCYCVALVIVIVVEFRNQRIYCSIISMIAWLWIEKNQYTHSYTKRTVRSTHLCTLREVLCGCCSCCAFIDTEKKEERVWERRLFIIYINIGMSVIFIVTIIISIKLLFKHNSTIYSISDCVNKSDLKMCIT